MKIYSILILCQLLVLNVKAQEKKPITHEDMWLLKRVGAPAISPDGKWAVFNVTEPSYDEKEQINDLWIVSTSGALTARKLTAGKTGENGYTWSPDGSKIAFSAKRDGEEETQIYILNIKDGGEAQKLTKLSSGASSPKWSPDGNYILFSSSIYPQCYADSTNKKMIEEKKKIKYKARVYTSFPIRNWDKWNDEKQNHLYIQNLSPDSTARNIFTEVSISKLEGFSYAGSCWTADSKSIIFSATTQSNTSAYQEPISQLYSVSINGSDAIQLTSDKLDYGNPIVSLDGNYLFCFSSTNNNNKVYNQNNLVRFDFPKMINKRNICENLDRPINNVVLSKTQVFISAENQGRDLLYSFSLDGSSMTLLTKTPTGCFNNISVSTNDKPLIIASHESSMMPPEIVKLNEDGSFNFLTNFNTDKLSKLDLKEAEPIWFNSSRGKKIRSLLVKPAGFNSDKKYPLFVVIHGGPAGSWKENWSYRWNYQLLSKPGYVLLLTDFTGSTGYGEKFSQEIQYDPFNGPGLEINEAAKDAITRFPFIDGTLQAAGGASYGGHLANWLQATTTHYKCLISHAGLVNSISQWGTSDAIFGREVMNGGVPWQDSKIWKEQNPYYYASKFKTPMLVTVGELDYRVPLNNSIENWHVLQRQKVPSKLIVFPEENHWILKAENSRFFYQEVHAWLEKYLK
ncbi:MAG: S9 family peptidase [Saprospiraceae bacterium]|nr:S9 family peptidase [Saprospiraceae bacterium]